MRKNLSNHKAEKLFIRYFLRLNKKKPFQPIRIYKLFKNTDECHAMYVSEIERSDF